MLTSQVFVSFHSHRFIHEHVFIDILEIFQIAEEDIVTEVGIIQARSSIEDSEHSGVVLIARSMNYKVGDLSLLNDINLFARPGMMIAMVQHFTTV